MLDPVNQGIEQHPGLLLHDIARLFRQCFGQRLRDLGLSEPQWRVVGTVNKFPGITQTQLAQLLGIGKAPLGKLIDRLEADGLLLRAPDEKDRRVRLLNVSDSGASVSKELVSRHQLFQSCYLQGLSQRRRDELERTLRTMYRNLSEQSGIDLGAGIMESLTLMHLITGISRLNSRHFDLQLKQLGFTRSQWLVMSAIRHREGWQQSELVQELNMGKAALGVLLRELELGGWVERQVSTDDRRARTLQLTSSCRRQLRSLGESFEKLHTSSLTGVADRERQSLSTSLTIIREQLKSIAQGHGEDQQEAHQ